MASVVYLDYVVEFAYPLKIMVMENKSVAKAPAVCESGKAAIIMCANVLANVYVSMQKSKIRI